VNIREAQDPDVSSINAMYNDTVSTTTVAWTEVHENVHTPQAWVEEPRHLGNAVLVARCRTIGSLGSPPTTISAMPRCRDAAKWPGYRFTVEHTIHVHHVHQDHQGVGVGGVLLDALIERALEAGKHSMIGAVDGDNAGSIRFHERHGFAVVGRLPELGFKFGRWLDLVLMQRMHV
jgi:phosphinothricin acetyltransferase